MLARCWWPKITCSGGDNLLLLGSMQLAVVWIGILVLATSYIVFRDYGGDALLL